MLAKNIPLVSIITPCRNSERFLEKTLLSVINQSYQNIEYIVIDGLSSDGTLDIIKKYRDKIAYWISEADRGMYHAINKGIQLAKGDIVCYINSDDILHANAIEHVVDYFAMHPDCDLIYGNLDYIDSDGEKKFTIIFPSFNSLFFSTSKFSMIGQPSSFWRRGLHERIGMFNDELKMASDFEFYIKAGLAGRLLHVDESLAAFRVHEDSLTTTGKDLGLAELAAIRKRHLSAFYYLLAPLLSSISKLYFVILNWRCYRLKIFNIIRRVLAIRE
jgi:glycosyltransferase involved in cell wall biosynthesis